VRTLATILIVPAALALVSVGVAQRRLGEGTARRDAGSVERLDPRLDAIVEASAKPELLAEHFGATEGPVWVQEGASGYLLFSDMPANVVYKWAPGGQVSVFLERSGFTGTDPLNVGAQSTSGRLAIILIGSNGLTLDPQGRLVIAAMADRAVARIEKDGTRTLLADRYEGKRLNGPNDLVVKSNGSIYFTDMTAGMRGRDKSPFRELSYTGVFLIKDGRLTLLDKDPGGGMPNGIALSRDEKKLHVGSAGQILTYDIQGDDNITNGRAIMETGTDGMKLDESGNFYLTHQGGVWIMSPEGTHLGTIHLPEVPGVSAANVAFGDADSRTLYITARQHLYRIRLKVPGIRPHPRT
jgi:gluconolactonase